MEKLTLADVFQLHKFPYIRDNYIIKKHVSTYAKCYFLTKTCADFKTSSIHNYHTGHINWSIM